MAEPKKRLTSTRSGNRRSHLALKAKSLSTCPKCKQAIASHKVCLVCGFYNGIDVLKLDEKSKAKDERKKAAQEQEESDSK